jgi:hypothetical protein
VGLGLAVGEAVAVVTGGGVAVAGESVTEATCEGVSDGEGEGAGPAGWQAVMTQIRRINQKATHKFFNLSLRACEAVCAPRW